jgi:hypothetical protein
MRPSGQLGTLAMAAFGLIVLAIVGLLAVDSWWAFGGAIALMLVGVGAMARFVQRLGRTGQSVEAGDGVRPQESEARAAGDELHSELWELDLPLDHPAHHIRARRGRPVERV